MDCSNVKKISDITDQIDYVDDNAGGKDDEKIVSCGQDGKYKELKDKYDKYFNLLNEEFVAKIMCKCCKELKPTGKEKVTWLEFYKCMKSKLNMDKHPMTIKKLEELIAYHTPKS